MSEVRVILLLDGRPVEIDPLQCGPTVKLAIAELVREALTMIPPPVAPKPSPKLAPPESVRLKPATSGA